ncbi:diguanylate cyclase domain-containing protein [Acinetobacter junii]|uniref:diguanylate cyclase domain-containing protein n=1 Tax=Acinetobacter junii TaxID=40215 RepID=UPI0024ACD4B3|nr:diguanylate cyclase [Acinetobacter junii]MDI6621364.1 diguanylate cyclase [Acinetobacter junii]
MISNLYKSTSLHALFRKSQFTIFAITFVICSCTFATISMFTMETYAKQNLQLLSQTVIERIQPAVVFKDKGAIDQILKDYTTEHAIRSIHVYDPQQQLLAESTKKIASTSFLQKMLDEWFLHDPIKLMIFHHQKKVGELVLYGSSENIVHFLKTIIIGLAISMFFIVIALLWSVNLTYRQIMQAIKPLTHIAQLVSDQKAYNLRFPSNHIKEFQNLNNVFNELLEEIQIWNTNLQKENRQLSFKAHHDQLTTLPNRHFFYEELLNIFENPSYRENSALIFIDNNKFKVINDRYGHLAGDAVLREMALRLKQSVRQEDFIARLGGDEFAIILHSIHHADHLEAIAEGLLASCKEPLDFNGEIIHFGFSLGIAFSQYAENPEDLVVQADQAMYKAKNLIPHWFLYKPEI